MFPTGIFTDPRWIALWAAMLGYMLDAMDVLLYVLAINAIRADFGLSNQWAGFVSSITLIASGFGGIVSGMLCDRIGRRLTLILTILVYSLGSGLSATSQSFLQLCLWRAVVGLGLGGEWSAGATLVAELWPPQHRGKAISLMQSGWAIGYMLAAALTGLILPRYGWRVLFLIGVLPALLTILIRRNVQEAPMWNRAERPLSFWTLFNAHFRRRTFLATSLATCVLFGYWGLFTWLPGFLSAPIAAGGAGLSIVRTSAWVFTMQIGTFFGYICFGWLSDRFGRRPAFAGYVLMAAILTPLYGALPRWTGAQAETWLLAAGPLIGFFGTGYFSLFGTMLAEIYPTAVRGTGLGFVYNFGRGLSALAPLAVGTLADRHGLGTALALNAAFFLAGLALIFTLPETRHTHLEDVH